MQTLNRINYTLERFMPLITPFSMILGIIFADRLVGFLFLAPWIFAFMTFSGSLNCGFSDLKNVICNPRPLLITLFLLHVWMPLMAFAAGHLFFSANPYLITGIIIEFAIPTGIISMIWVTIHKGNIPLTLSIILLDTIITPFFMPITLKLLVGVSVQVGILGMMKDLLLMIAIPAVLSMAVHDLSKGKLSASLSPRLAPFSKLAIVPVIAINSTKLQPFFQHFNPLYLAVTALIFVLALSGYLWGFFASKLFHQNNEDTVSIFFNGSMRNISAGAVIAVQYFPAETVFPVMIGTLFQQILAACAGAFLARISKQKSIDSGEEASYS